MRSVIFHADPNIAPATIDTLAKSDLITFGAWAKTFIDSRVWATIDDNTIEAGTGSHRLAHTGVMT